MNLSEILRQAADKLDDAAVCLRDRIEALQRVVTAASWAKAELNRELPGFQPLMERSVPT